MTRKVWRKTAVPETGFLPVMTWGGVLRGLCEAGRLLLMQNGKQIQRNYCLFWVKERTGYYIEEFADLLRKLLCSEKQKKDV